MGIHGNMVVVEVLEETTRPTSSKCTEDEEGNKQLVPSKTSQSPTPQEVIRFINDDTGYIEEFFRCMIRGISNSKLSMVESGTKNSSIPEVEENDVSDTKDDLVLSRNDIGSANDLSIMMQKLDYFIDIMCNLKDNDTKDSYSIIVLYEKMVFDLKSEIASLRNRLKIHQTIMGRKQGTIHEKYVGR